ncbi:aspartokinase [Agrilactobacillus composti DSM 18527 = JCM 14202]|nr:aspartokinase [Agrilactobacillus composti DSM 18527 = JCM 14202]
MAKAVAAEEYENFTDVDAIYAANPNIIPNPRKITHLTFQEMRELSYAGFSVFHDEALIPAIEGKVPVVVKNTNHPDLPGTLISETKPIDQKNIVSGIASDSGFTGIYLRKYLMNKQVGFTLKLLQILADFGVSYEHMPSGIDDLTIIIRSRELTPDLEAKIQSRIESEIHPDDFQITHNYAMVMIVGEGIQDRIGTMAAATASIAAANVSIVMLNTVPPQFPSPLGFGILTLTKPLRAYMTLLSTISLSTSWMASYSLKNGRQTNWRHF